MVPDDTWPIAIFIMITYLNGTLAEKQPTRVVVDIGGVGYEVFVPLSTYDSLPSEGADCKLLAFDYVREDQHTLFGFASGDERRMFTMLMGVSGIGPRLAMSALSGLSVRELTAAIVERDVKRLSTIQGLGKKTAERIVIDIRDRIDDADALAAIAGGDNADNVAVRDAVLALVALGYKQNDARGMIEKLIKAKPSITDTEEMIRKALAQ